MRDDGHSSEPLGKAVRSPPWLHAEPWDLPEDSKHDRRVESAAADNTLDRGLYVSDSLRAHTIQQFALDSKEPWFMLRAGRRQGV